jgi:hypothetical protein
MKRKLVFVLGMLTFAVLLSGAAPFDTTFSANQTPSLSCAADPSDADTVTFADIVASPLPGGASPRGGCSGDLCGCFLEQQDCIAGCPPVGDPRRMACYNACKNANHCCNLNCCGACTVACPC